MQYASESSAVGSESNTEDTESNAVVTLLVYMSNYYDASKNKLVIFKQ